MPLPGPPGQPRITVSQLPDLCRLGPRLLTMDGFFRTWMINHFASPDTIKDPNLQDFIWDNDPKQTRIAIELNTTWDPRIVEFKPSIIVKRGAWKSIKMGINNRMMGKEDNLSTFLYANYWQGSHTLFVCAAQDGECEQLATEVFQELNEFGPRLQVILRLFNFVVAEVGEIAKLEEANEHWVIPINVAYVMEEVWTVHDEAAPFKRIDLSLLNL